MAGTLNGRWDRTIDEDCLIYQTFPVYQQYEICANEGLTVDGNTGYYLEGWIGEEYVAIGNNADKLVKLLVEFEDDDRKTLSTGESWDLGGGFTLTAKEIDLEG
ncbi:MAG: S-layer protein domain-containing protein, partial [Euryarchaeota archaeon]|nr:S-layer protein domain-containing protein [Euryarchaeota archaeon]